MYGILDVVALPIKKPTAPSDHLRVYLIMIILKSVNQASTRYGLQKELCETSL